MTLMATHFCEHAAYTGDTVLWADCDCCTAKRGRKVGFILADLERDDVRKKLGLPGRRCAGGVRIGDGWKTFSAHGKPLD